MAFSWLASMASLSETSRTVTTPSNRESALPITSLAMARTVLRGGFGLFFERVQGNDVYNAALNPPFAYQPQANNVYFSDPNTSAIPEQLQLSPSFPPR